jgi:glycerol-3-phosphate dehydrogenase
VDNFDLVVIGAGVTGLAVARDAAIRGIRTLVVERGEFGSGTSGRWHSMLQSGGRYVVTDTEYAAECMRERLIMERIAPFARKDTEGLFVAFHEDDPEFAARFESAAQEAHIPVKWLDTDQVASIEPHIAPVRGGFTVPDAVFHAWKMVPAIAASAMANGATIRTHTQVIGFETTDGRISGVHLRAADGTESLVSTQSTVIAAGAWASDLGALAGLNIEVETAKGAMLVLPFELVTTVVNRLRPPQSFDISVPLNGSTVFGTTSSIVAGPEEVAVTPEEIEELTAEVLKFHPELVNADRSTWSSYAGVRPLVSAAPGEGGAVSRKHHVFDGSIDGAWGIVGGSFTTHRAMAEDVTDRVAAYLGNAEPSRTAFQPLQPAPEVPWSAQAPLQAAGIAKIS